MKLSFKSESDFTGANVKKFENALQNTSVLLHHANFCWHCQAMRGEFEKYKSQVKHDIVEVESAALDKLRQYPTIYKKATPSDGSMYFPMIMVFIRSKNANPKRYVYKGPRTSEDLNAFVEKKQKAATARKPAATPRKPAAKAYKKKPASSK